MTAPSPQCQPRSADAPVTILRGWAKAYRDSPEHRFPSDPHAEFFPVDMEAAAGRIEELESRTSLVTFNEACKRIEELENALRASIVAIDDRLHSYAGEFCDEKHVKETAARLNEYGTIGYIAHIQEKNRAALPQSSGVARGR